MDVFDALADPVRRRVLTLVAAGPRRVVDLAAELPVSRPAVSKHLRLLRQAGLVRGTASGRETHYSLDPAGLAPVTRLLAALRSPHGPVPESALDALALEVRRTVRDRATTAKTTKEQREIA